METRSKTNRQHRSMIEKLPVEMLLEIFQYLDSFSIRRCSEVCITFFYVTLRREFKDFFKLTMTEEYLASNCSIGKTFSPGKRTKRSFDHLTLVSVNFKTVAFAINFFNRLGEEITELHIHETFFKPSIVYTETKKIEEKFRQNILINFPNLKYLSVDTDMALDKIQYFPLALKTIFVNCTIYYENQKNFKDFLVKQKGLTNLEKLNFSYLPRRVDHQQQIMRIYKHLEMSNETKSIIEISPLWNIQINCNLLEHAVIDPTCITGFYIYEILSIPYHSLKKLPKLKEVILILSDGNPCLGEHHEIVELSHVKKLSVVSPRKTKCDTCILQMVSSFSGLTELSFSGNLTEHQVRLIFDQLPKLRKLELIGRIPKNIFDSSEFAVKSIEKLKNLQKLFIVDVSSYSETAISNDCLLKFAHLPNLKLLRFSPSNENDEFKIDGIRNLVRQCPNISNFCSTDNAFTGEMGREMMRGWTQLNTLLLLNVTFDKETWDFAKTNCRFLRYVSVSDQNRYLSDEKWSIFKNVPCLKAMKIEHRFTSRSDYYHRIGNNNSTSRYSKYGEDPAVLYKFITPEDEEFGYLRTDDEDSEDEYLTDEEE